MIEIQVSGTDDLRKLAKELRRYGTAGKRAERDIRKALEAEVAKAVPAARQGILNTRAKGPESTGLRRRLADVVHQRKGRRGIATAVVMDGSRMPSGQRSLPAYYEGVKKRWRHPVHGNTDVWVTQRARPSFYRTLRKHRARVEAAVEAAAQRIARDLDR